MIFCSHCFKSPEIKAIINDINEKGTCPICGSENVPIYDTGKNDHLLGIFDNILSVYTVEKDLPNDYPKDDLRTLADAFKFEWDIFEDIPDDRILNILKELSITFVEDYPAVFEELVGIAEKYDIEYLQKHSILHTKKWEDFVETIKHKNRFHSNLIDQNLFKEYCLAISTDIAFGNQRFYRGRISEKKEGFTPTNMGAPSKGLASEGRANSAGISRLYLASDPTTTLHEIRAAEYDYVTIGTFKPCRSIHIVDLQKIDKISPFNEDIDCTALAINKEHLAKINEEMSRTMRKGDSPLDYLPTQYICDFIMSITDDEGQPVFDGIMYKSAMHSKGANLAIFYPDLFKCTYSRTYEVDKLIYHKKSLNKYR